jgi:hypothetical protein
MAMPAAARSVDPDQRKCMQSLEPVPGHCHYVTMQIGGLDARLPIDAKFDRNQRPIPHAPCSKGSFDEPTDYETVGRGSHLLPHPPSGKGCNLSFSPASEATHRLTLGRYDWSCLLCFSAKALQLLMQRYEFTAGFHL